MIYNNIYCVMCNHFKFNYTSLKFLNITLYNETSNYSAEYERLNFLNKNKIEAHLYEKSDDMKVFECDTLIDECPLSYNYQETVNMCHNYTQLVKYHDLYYKNRHCALCTGLNTPKLSCLNISEVREYNNLNNNHSQLNNNSLVYKWHLNEFRLVENSKFNIFLEFKLKFIFYVNLEKHLMSIECKFLKSDFSLVVSNYKSDLMNNDQFKCKTLFDKNSLLSFTLFSINN